MPSHFQAPFFDAEVKEAAVKPFGGMFSRKVWLHLQGLTASSKPRRAFMDGIQECPRASGRPNVDCLERA